MNFIINENYLEALDEYHTKTMDMEFYKVEKNYFDGDFKNFINDDLIYNVPIYDMGHRRYAAFCSFTEAVWKKENDIKGNGIHFLNTKIETDFDWFMLFYLFRLCGSGINYKPKSGMFMDFKGTHGFGNFWVVNSILEGKSSHEEWLIDLSKLNKPFTDSKGYLLPQISFKGLESGHMKKFILEYSIGLVEYLYNRISNNKTEIYQVTDLGNEWLKKSGFKNQNFVLTAFAADLAEYYPNLVDPKSFVYAGTNATKCIKLIFPKNGKVNDFDYINSVLQFQSDRYNLNPIDCEDSRNCDVIRYFKEYQSKDHIANNNSIIMKNNSILKKRIGTNEYYNLIQNF